MNTRETTMSAASIHEITKTARLLMNGRPHELRVIGTKVQSGVYETPERLAQAAVEFDGAANVYIGLNPTSKPPYDIRPGDAVGDVNIERIRWLPVDIDNGEPPMPVVDYLTTAGFPRPIIASSGRGWWLLYHVDQPNTPDMADLRHRFLMALKAKFPGVDVSVSNASRVARMFGTMNLKDGAKRSLVSSAPDEIVVVDQALIEAIAADVPERKAPRPEDGIAGDVAVYLDALAERDIDVKRDKPWTNGSTLYELTTCPFVPNDTHEGAYLIAWLEGTVSFGCLGARCVDAKHGILDLRERLGIRRGETTVVEATGKPTLNLMRMSDVKAIRPRTVWGQRINEYDLNGIMGDEKIGKGLVTAWLASELTNGRMTGRPENVVYFSTEENTETVQRPRFEAAGADLDRIFGAPMGTIGLPSCMPDIIEQMLEVRATWFLLDGANKHFAKPHSPIKGEDVAEVLGIIGQHMAKHQFTFWTTLHTNRTGGVSSRDKIAHQIEFKRVLRSGLVIGSTKDTTDDERVIVHDWNNTTGETDDALTIRFEKVPVRFDDGQWQDVSRIVMGEESDVTAEDIFLTQADREGAVADAKARRTKIEACAEDIIRVWTKAKCMREMPQDSFLGEHQTGWADPKTRERARKKLGIIPVSDRDEKTGTIRTWVWEFPADAAERFFQAFGRYAS